jgi:hypothetical protein
MEVKWGQNSNDDAFKLLSGCSVTIARVLNDSKEAKVVSAIMAISVGSQLV